MIEVFKPGSVVSIRQVGVPALESPRVNGTVVRVIVSDKDVQYVVAYWKGMDRVEITVEEFEVVVCGDGRSSSRTEIGFHTVPVPHVRYVCFASPRFTAERTACGELLGVSVNRITSIRVEVTCPKCREQLGMDRVSK